MAARKRTTKVDGASHSQTLTSHRGEGWRPGRVTDLPRQLLGARKTLEHRAPHYRPGCQWPWLSGHQATGTPDIQARRELPCSGKHMSLIWQQTTVSSDLTMPRRPNWQYPNSGSVLLGTAVASLLFSPKGSTHYESPPPTPGPGRLPQNLRPPMPAWRTSK